MADSGWTASGGPVPSDVIGGGRRRHPHRVPWLGPVARLAGELDAAAQRGPEAVPVDTAPRESLLGRLVAGRRDHIGTRAQESEVRLDDRLGHVEDQPSRPQVIREIMPKIGQVRRQSPVQDERPPAQCKPHPSTLLPAVPRAPKSIKEVRARDSDKSRRVLP